MFKSGMLPLGRSGLRSLSLQVRLERTPFVLTLAGPLCVFGEEEEHE